MCLIVAKKRNPKYIYKVFRIINGKLVSPHQYTLYRVGKNQPKYITTNKNVINGGALHAYTAYRYARYATVGNVMVRLPYDKKALIAFGDAYDVALKYIFLPKKLYQRIIKRAKPNQITTNGIPVYFSC